MSKKTYNSYREMVQDCSPEELRKFKKAFDDYLIRTNQIPIFQRIEAWKLRLVDLNNKEGLKEI